MKIDNKGGGIIYLEGGSIGITADPGENSYDPSPLNDLLETGKNSYDPPQIVFMNMIKGIYTMFIACVYYK